jgi:hypothetical protein
MTEVITIVPAVQSGFPSNEADPFELLPSDAAIRMRALQEELTGARAITRDSTERLRDAIADSQDADARVSYLRGDNSRRMVAEDHPSMIHALSAQTKAACRVEELKEYVARHSSHSDYLGSLVSNNLSSYLCRLPHGTKIEAFKLDKSATRPKERPENAVTRHRADGLATKAGIEWARDAPSPNSKIQGIVKDHVEKLARRGCPNVLRLVERSETLDYPTTPTSLNLIGIVRMEDAPAISGYARGEIPDAIAYLTWLFPDVVLAKLAVEIEARSDDSNALTDAERERRLRNLKADLLMSERLECAAVDLCQKAGIAMRYRLDTDPRAILNVVAPAIDE